MSQRARGALLALLLGGAAACGSGGGGGQPFSDDSTSDTGFERDSTATTDESSSADEEVEIPENYVVAGTLEFEDFVLLVSGPVVDPEHYDLTYESDGLALRTVRDGDAVYLARAADADALETRPFVATDVADGTALGFLEANAAFGLGDDTVDVAGADVAIDALLELLLTDPTSLLDLDALVGADDDEPIDVPPEIAGPLDDLGLQPPPLEASIEVDEGALVQAEVAVGGSIVDYRLAALYTDHGRPTLADLAIPSPDQIDATPWVEEDELAAFTAADLLAPATVPEDLVLVGAIVLDPDETVEGCTQVELDYATPPDEPPGEAFVTLFLLPEACAVAADPSVFDETTGGRPSRGDGAEVLIDGTVVQVQAASILTAEAIDVMVASIAPVTAEQLIAAVVPSD